jgi:adenylosuccinate synthase
MTITTILDGQYGSCGKGAYAAWLAKQEQPDTAVRTGAPNAGHSIHIGQESYALRHIPAACVSPNTRLVIPAGGLINVDVLLEEIDWLESRDVVVKDRLWIDPRATVIDPKHEHEEEHMRDFNGSTREGIGACRAARSMRTAMKIGALSEATGLLKDEVRKPLFLDRACNEENVHVEMTQGYGLSRDFGPYPFVTSSNIVPAQALVEMGVTCWDVKVHMLMRTFPIRVAGNSGPLDHEVDWATLAEESFGYIEPERTTVTRLVRCIGRWSEHQAVESCKAVNPDRIILMFGDYAYPEIGRAVRTDRAGTQWDSALQHKWEQTIARMWDNNTDWEQYRRPFRLFNKDIHAISLGFGAIARTPTW